MILKKILVSILVSILFINFKIYSQQLNNQLEFFHSQQIGFEIQKSKENKHSIFKPTIQSNIFIKNTKDSIKRNWFVRKLFYEDFSILNKKDIVLKVNPLLNLKLSKNLDTEMLSYTNTRGIEFKGDIGTNFSFYSSFYENQSKFEPFVYNFIEKRKVVPGQGAPKFSRDSIFDYSRVEGYLSYSVDNKINFQLGHSKHFIGEGYRSLLLSDNSFSYPFIRTSFTFNKFQYVMLWSQYQSFSTAYYFYHHRKYSSINYLSYIIKQGFEISLFESVIWPANTIDKNKFNLNFFNPLILFRSLQYEFNSEQNIMLGLNAKIKTSKFSQLSTQFAVDNIDFEFLNESKYAFQFALKYFDVFHNKLNNHKLFLHVEYNQIANYTYTYQNAYQNYSNYNQELTHPAGAGLKEYIGIFSYNYKRIILNIKYNKITNSSDFYNTNFGSNIFLPDNSTIKQYEIAKNFKTTVQNIDLSIRYTINHVTNLQLFVGIKNRKFQNEIEKNDNLFLNFGIISNLNNYYFDAM